MIALSYKKPWFASTPKKNFKYLEGRYLEEVKDQEIGRVDLITDFFGPFSYAPLSKYVQVGVKN